MTPSGSAGAPPPDEDPVTLRVATPDDARGISRVKIEGWKRGYRGLIPDAVLEALDLTEETARREGYLADPTSPVINLVAVRSAEVVGWLAYGPHRDDDLADSIYTEIYAVYVRPDQWRSGVGATMMRAGLERIRATRRPGVTLWVLEKNARGRAFYERMGLRPDGGRKTIGFDEARLTEVRYRIEPEAPSPAG